MYPELMVIPMREELVRAGIKETRTAEEVDALWEKVKDSAEVIYAVGDFDYGMREFGVRDDNGYHLAFGAPSKATWTRVGV